VIICDLNKIRLLFIIIILFFISEQICCQEDLQKHYPGVLDKPADYTGWEGQTKNPAAFTEIRIGLFAPNDPDDQIGTEMSNAAAMAIEEANAHGGYLGIPFRMVRRWSSDPWGAGSKEMIRLAYEDSVWAVIGSSNGDATHIAEQVVTKARLPLLSPISADPTLTYIGIPWIFRLPPDDQMQAEVIFEEGIQLLSLSRIGIVTSTNHDGRIFAERILRTIETQSDPPLFHFQVSEGDLNLTRLVQRNNDFNPDGIIVRLPKNQIFALLSLLEEKNYKIPIIIPWIPGLQESELREQYSGKILIVSPFSTESNLPYGKFANNYKNKFGGEATPCAAYTYDAITLICQSIGKSGLNRARLRAVISGEDWFYGVTGKISWDNGGGNRGQPRVKKVH